MTTPLRSSAYFCKTWPRNDYRSVLFLKLGFLNGTKKQINTFLNHSIYWCTPLNKCGISFICPHGVNPLPSLPDTDLRVKFISDRNLSSYSYVGCEARTISQPDVPTIVILDTGNNIQFIQHIYHEFGHALGLEHEHQHPLCNLHFIAENVLLNVRSEDEMNSNILLRNAAEGIVVTPYDPTSIMHYTILRSWTGENRLIAQATVPSSSDYEMIKVLYPIN